MTEMHQCYANPAASSSSCFAAPAHRHPSHIPTQWRSYSYYRCLVAGMAMLSLQEAQTTPLNAINESKR